MSDWCSDYHGVLSELCRRVVHVCHNDSKVETNSAKLVQIELRRDPAWLINVQRSTLNGHHLEFAVLPNPASRLDCSEYPRQEE
jgi:hypothetical protein